MGSGRGRDVQPFLIFVCSANFFGCSPWDLFTRDVFEDAESANSSCPTKEGETLSFESVAFEGWPPICSFWLHVTFSAMVNQSGKKVLNFVCKKFFLDHLASLLRACRTRVRQLFEPIYREFHLSLHEEGGRPVVQSRLPYGGAVSVRAKKRELLEGKFPFFVCQGLS